jgi:hypothetical protein
MNPDNLEKWKNVGKTLKNIGAKTIGGYLEGGLVGVGVEILGGFLKKQKGVTIGADPDSVVDQISELTQDDLVELKKVDSEAAMIAAFAAEENLQDNVTQRQLSDNATNSKFVQFTRPGLAWKWSTVGAIISLAGCFGWVPALSEKTYEISVWFTASILGGIILSFFGSRGTEKVAAILGNRFGKTPLDRIGEIFKSR